MQLLYKILLKKNKLHFYYTNKNEKYYITKVWFFVLRFQQENSVKYNNSNNKNKKIDKQTPGYNDNHVKNNNKIQFWQTINECCKLF